MATYSAYRHIELDKVGYSKKRVCNRSSEIFQVLCTPPSNKSSPGLTPLRRSSHSDSFTRLFGTPEVKKITPRRASLTKQDVTNRNPVTGDGVNSWDQRPSSRNNSPRVHNERNPVTGETYTIVTPPATTPTKSMENGFAHFNGNSTTPVITSTPMVNGNNNNNNNKIKNKKNSISQLQLQQPQQQPQQKPILMNGNGNAVNGNMSE